MKQKETHWSRFADNFEARNTYVVGKTSKQITFDELAKQTNLGNTLELACGNGTYSKILAPNAQSLTCTDFSEEMITVSKQRLKDFPNVAVQQANCFQLPFQAETFDTVFMANLLHVVPTPEKAIAEAKRVLKVGGQIIALDYTQTGMTIINRLRLMYRYTKAYGNPPKAGRNVDDKVLRELFETNGLEVEFAKLIGRQTKAAFGKARKELTTNN